MQRPLKGLHASPSALRVFLEISPEHPTSLRLFQTAQYTPSLSIRLRKLATNSVATKHPRNGDSIAADYVSLQRTVGQESDRQKDHTSWRRLTRHQRAEIDSQSINNLKLVHGNLKQVARQITGHKRLSLNTSLRWTWLSEQSDVFENKKKVQLQVDDLRGPTNFKLWLELLRFRKRVFGDKGVKHIWMGMRMRNIDIPLSEDYADIFWEYFLLCRLTRADVVTYASELRAQSGKVYPKLYQIVVTHLLQESPYMALDWHRRLFPISPPPPGTLKGLAIVAARNKTSLAVFPRIYTESSERNIYDTLVPILKERGEFMLAAKWNLFLIRNHDHPTRSNVSDSVISESVKKSQEKSPSVRVSKPIIHSDISSIYHHMAYTENNSSSVDEKLTESSYAFSREAMNRILGEVHSVKPKTLDDRFCARLFATKAFSVNAVIKGLSIFGAQSIGSMSLRELALRTRSSHELSEKLRELRAVGISVRKTVFSRVLERFIEEDRPDLVHELLQNDQHPDELENESLQHKLLDYYCSQKRWDQVHLIVAIMAARHLDFSTSYWNLLLQVYGKSGEREKLLETTKDMLSKRISLTSESLNALHSCTLRPRHPSKRPVHRRGDGISRNMSYDDLRVITRIFLNILESGQSFPAWRWQEILLRYGITGRLRELERLVYSLASRYTPKHAPLTGSSHASAFTLLRRSYSRSNPGIAHFMPYHVPLNLSTASPSHPLRQLFTPIFMRAIIAWGFKNGMKALKNTHGRTVEGRYQKIHFSSTEWARGIRILHQLRRKFKVDIPTSFVRVAISQRLLMLFGPGRSSRTENRIAKYHNRATFDEMVQVCEKIWDFGELKLKETPVSKRTSLKASADPVRKGRLP